MAVSCEEQSLLHHSRRPKEVGIVAGSQPYSTIIFDKERHRIRNNYISSKEYQKCGRSCFPARRGLKDTSETALQVYAAFHLGTLSFCHVLFLNGTYSETEKTLENSEEHAMILVF